MIQRVGLIGCGNISPVYFHNATRFRDFAIVACADLDPAAAQRRADRFAIPARGVQALLASDDIDIVLNLTIPEAHADVSLAALEAGKHVYSEKPLATHVAGGRAIIDLAKSKGLRVGAAPDTFLGPSIQHARALIDAGAIGKVLTGLAAVLSHGMEHWHPNPDFFFRPGGGPVFDMGPYYLTTLVNLLGPVASVQASGQIGFAERVVTTPGSAMRGRSIEVETLTSVQALLEFVSGAQVTFLASWDVWRHGLPHIELHGRKASLRLPDPNMFGGVLEIAKGTAEPRVIDTREQPFGDATWPVAAPLEVNHRGLGLADMARGIIDGRPHRANGEVALHVLAVMAGILEAAAEQRRVTIAERRERPSALGASEAGALSK
jgi:predicted dehydrogenase